MTDINPSRYVDGELLSGVRRLRRRTPEEKIRIVEDTYISGMSVSLVALQHGIAPDQLFNRRRLMTQGALTAARAGEEFVPASNYRAIEAQVRELQRMLGKKTMENDILREATSRAAGPKNCHCGRPRCRGWPASAVAQAAGIARPHLSAMRNRPSPRRRRRPPLPDAEFADDIRALIADLPTYGYAQDEMTGHIFRAMRPPS